MNKRRQRHLLLIADNHPIFLKGLADVFRSRPDIKLVAQCRDGTEAMAAIREYVPDVAMIDITMPGMDGMDILAKVTAEGLPTRIVFLTATASGPQIMEAISGGAKGVLFKSSSPAEIASGVRKVAAGKYEFPKDLAQAVRARKSKRQKISRRPGHQLTPRENEVTQFVIKGLSNREIGQQMQLSEGTVKIHLHNIYKKLNISNRTSLATLMVSR